MKILYKLYNFDKQKLINVITRIIGQSKKECSEINKIPLLKISLSGDMLCSSTEKLFSKIFMDVLNSYSMRSSNAIKVSNKSKNKVNLN